MKKNLPGMFSYAIVWIASMLICFNSQAQTPKSGPLNVCYVEVNSNNILNVGAYTLKNGGQQLFDIAIIFAANINYDAALGKAVLSFNPNVTTVLSDTATFIRPLRTKGIKVLLDVLGNHQGAGICNFTSRAAARDFATQLANAVTTYNLDGIDFDDEYAAYGTNGRPGANDSSFVMLVQELRSLMPTKIISFYYYGPAASRLSWNGSRVGDYVNYSWNASYGTYSAPSVPPLGKPNLGPAATWISNTSQSTAKTNAQRTVSDGYGLYLCYDLHGYNETTYLSAISTSLYNDSTKLTGTLQPWPPVVTPPAGVKKSLTFNGSNQYLNAGAINLSGSAMSFEGWVKPAAFKSAFPYISTVMGIESGSNTALLRFGDASLANNKLQFVLNIGGTQRKLASATSFSTNTWYHIAATYDGATMKLYVNGTLDASMAQTGSVTANSTFNIGYSYEMARVFSGGMDEIRVWKKALTAAEIAGKCYVNPASTGLEAYWRMGHADGSGTTAQDTTGHGHTGTFTNMTTANWSTEYPSACASVIPNFALPPSIEEEAAEKSGILVYPNPVQRGGNIHIALPMNTGAVTVIVYNAGGKPMHSFRSANQSISIPTAELTSGVYFYRIANEKGKTHKGSFVVK